MSPDRTINGGFDPLDRRSSFVPLEPHAGLLGLSPAAIESRAKELAHFVREYSRKQKAIWQRIPWLALQAYDVHNSDSAIVIQKKAFEEGYWTISFETTFGVRFSFNVDLATGELSKYTTSAATDELLALFAFDVEMLNAEKIAEMCRSWARSRAQKNACECKNAEHDAFVKYHNVPEIYTRGAPSPRPGPVC